MQLFDDAGFGHGSWVIWSWVPLSRQVVSLISITTTVATATIITTQAYHILGIRTRTLRPNRRQANERHVIRVALKNKRGARS